VGHSVYRYAMNDYASELSTRRRRRYSQCLPVGFTGQTASTCTYIRSYIGRIKRKGKEYGDKGGEEIKKAYYKRLPVELLSGASCYY
jgi:hypothetical protein